MAKNAKSENPPKTETAVNKKNATKDKQFDLAKDFVRFGLLAVAVLGGAAIYAALQGPDAERVDAVKDVLSILLPVISAWIGTILAFYFSEKNYAAATDSTTKLYQQFTTVEEKLKSITAKEVMIDISLATKLVLKENQKESEIKLMEHIINGKLEPEGKNRLPILDHQMIPKYVIHRSIIDKFIVKVATAAIPAKKSEELTLQDMLDDPFFANILKNSFRTVAETANLAQVKACIDKDDACSDVFVTEDGGKKSKVLGWITNVIVTKKSVV
jgi:hypothetical protein